MPDEPVHLIAEAGTNHNGDVRTGKALIDAARAAGASCVKFQMLFPEGLYLPRFYADGVYRDSEVFRTRAETALTPDDFRELAGYCGERKIPFAASVFDHKGVELVDELGVPFIKIASCDLNNSPLLVAAAETGRKLVISTGMSTLGDIERAMADVTATGNHQVVLMHCVSMYPCPVETANLPFIDTLRAAFGLEVGFSDHTESSLAAAIAVSKGATWVEKHITLNRASPGFDHAYAMEPAGFAAFARDVVAASAACIRRTQKVGEEEMSVRRRARRALYAACDVAAGERITRDKILIVRPEGPMPPNALAQVLNCRARRPIHRYEALSMELIEPR